MSIPSSGFINENQNKINSAVGRNIFVVLICEFGALEKSGIQDKKHLYRYNIECFKTHLKFHFIKRDVI